MSRALITGIAGQDGWYLSELLRDAGTEVFGLVLPEDEAALPPGVTGIVGDVRDASSLRSALEESDPDAVYNLASVSAVAESWTKPELVAEVNGLGVVRMLAAIRDSQRPIRFLQASSAEIFGDAPAPQDERTPIRPGSPYGAAKAFAHHSVAAYRAAGMWAASAILYNHESPRRPHQFVTRKITKSVAAIAEGSSEPLVLGNLDARRDWGFARDYMQALVRIASAPRAEDYVVATGVSHTVREFVTMAFAHVGITDWSDWVRSDTAFLRASDSHEQRGDATKLRDELGWRPTVELGELVAMMVDADRAELRGAGRSHSTEA